jgi:peptide/nickel transport system substrate-binding protein
MKIKHLAWAVPFLGLAVIALLVVTKSDTGSALIYARGTDSTTLDPAEVQWGEDAKVVTNLYENLVTFDGDSTAIVPRLATSWETSADGKTWTFELREGVTFHDGTPFNADAVAFTFARLTDENHPHRPKKVPYGEVFTFIGKVEALEGKAVFTLKNPNSTFLQILALFGAGIVSPTAVKEHGGDFGINPSGTGPYRLENWRQKEKLVLERNDNYWGEKPAIERVIFLPVQNAQTAIEKLKNGEVHIVDNIALGDVEVVENTEGLRVERETSLNVAYLGFNLKKAPYDDIHFRRAVALAIDRDELNDLVYYGQAEPARNIVPPAIWRDTGNLAPYESNLEKAKAELAKVELPDGFVAEIWHMTFPRPYMPEAHRVAEYIQNRLAKIGLDLKIQPFEKAAYTEKLKDHEHPMYLLGWSADYADPDNFFHPLLHGDSGDDLNNSFFNNAEFNDAVSKAQIETDPKMRGALYRRAAGIYRSMIPTLPLVHVKQVIACSDRINYNRHPIEVRLYPVTFKKP